MFLPLDCKDEQEVVKPLAIFCKFCCENGATETQIIYLEGDEKEDDCMYRIMKSCNDFSGKYGLNVWVEASHTIVTPTEAEEIYHYYYGLS